MCCVEHFSTAVKGGGITHYCFIVINKICPDVTQCG